MIKLELSKKPRELTIAVQKKLTADFIKAGNKGDVYKKSYIEKAVKKLAFGKCCFSEILLDTKSTYTEIEHFYPKDLHPNKVVEWGNLIPSCKKVNTSKGVTDTSVVPIINPFKDNPSDHLYFNNFRLYDKDVKGYNTKEHLALNDREHFVNPRAKVSLEIINLFDDFYNDNIKNADILKLSPIKTKNQINKIKGYLAGINRKTEFSACIATAIKDFPFYETTLVFLNKNGFWDQEFESYKQEIDFCFLG